MDEPRREPDDSRRAFDPDPSLIVDRGRFGPGFVIGLLGGCIGLLAVELVAKGRRTKRGARYGAAMQIALGVLKVAVAALTAPHR